VNRLVRAWRRIALGERSRQVMVIDGVDLKSFCPASGMEGTITASHWETETTTRRQRRVAQVPVLGPTKAAS
jgi:hypothetical protein